MSNFQPLFQSKSIEEKFQENGYYKIGKISDIAIQELLHLIKSLGFDDNTRFGTNVVLDTPDFELRKKMKSKVIQIVEPFLKDILFERSIISASFLNKLPIKSSFLSPHQDWTYHAPEDSDSVMGWIPLVDVNENNGALGVIKGSHRFYDYISAFPFPMAYTPVYKNNIRLFSYLEFIDMKAGEIVFFNNNLIHGSFPNYTDSTRYALNFCLGANQKQLICYIMNPKTKGKTVFKFNTDEDFTIIYNNSFITSQFNKGNIDIKYKLIEELPYEFSDISWKTLELKLIDTGNTKNFNKYQLVKEVFPSEHVDNPLVKKSYLRHLLDKFKT